MDSYRILYRIRVEHDYSDGKPCTTLQCRLTPQGEALARWRGLLFRQTAPGEWAVLFNREPDTGLDTLMLALSIADASFPIYTAWDDFRPSANYELELPRKKETLEAANAGTPMQTVLHFHAPSVQWEYLFVPHSVSDLRGDRLMLEDTAGTMEFSAFKEHTAYGRKVYRTVSKLQVPMHQAYGCRLRVTTQEEGKPKRVLLPQVPPPEMGTYMDVPKGILRQVCYY